MNQVVPLNNETGAGIVFIRAFSDAERLVKAHRKLAKSANDKTALARVSMVESLRGVRHTTLPDLDEAAQLLAKDKKLLARFDEYRSVRPFQAVQEAYQQKTGEAEELQKTNLDAGFAMSQAAMTEMQTARNAG